jgi:hypothetical protein
MRDRLQNLAATLAGIVIGLVFNMSVLAAAAKLVPPPEGVDPMNAESLAANIDRFGPEHFAGPFLAHALGTFVGALFAVRFSARRSLLSGWIVGAFFLLGGIMATTVIPAPAWFIALDLVGAYAPMAWLGGTLGLALRIDRPVASGQVPQKVR